MIEGWLAALHQTADEGAQLGELAVLALQPLQDLRRGGDLIIRNGCLEICPSRGGRGM